MSNAIPVLNDLIETLKDGQEGFRASAEDVQSSTLKTTLSEYSLQRSRFAGELQSLAHSLGVKDPTNSGSVASAIHRGWIDLKSALSKQDEHAVLAECERGEDSAVAAYRKAIDSGDLPSNVLETVQRQFVEIKEAHNTVRDLRDSTAAK